MASLRISLWEPVISTSQPQPAISPVVVWPITMVLPLTVHSMGISGPEAPQAVRPSSSARDRVSRVMRLMRFMILSLLLHKSTIYVCRVRRLGTYFFSVEAVEK